uniref:Transmembrane channel-like protein n=1 Tax=Malurus cyaneus samueli TaxID=2593467 RepID=A0A8C5U2F3_9PASS
KRWKRTSSKSLKKALSEVKGKFGTGIQSYFSFLRFLVLLNFIIFILMFSFITLPIIISKYGIFNNTIVNISPKYIGKHLLYAVVTAFTNSISTSFSQGILEVTSLFYGYYTIDAIWISTMRYNLPLAYLLATFAYLALSLLWIIKRSVEGFKQNLVHDADPFQSYCNKVFAGWDFCITDPNAARLKHRSLQCELQVSNFHLFVVTQKIAERTMKEKLRIYSLRIFINIIVLAILSGFFYSIYRVTVFSQENSNVSIRNDTRTDSVKAGDYSKRNCCERVKYLNTAPFIQGSENFGIRFCLSSRCVFLRLANIGVLLFSLWSQISDCGTDKCKPCGYNYKLYPCWESDVGQEMYKLMIFDFIVILAVPLFVDFPRMLLVTHCSCKLVQWFGLQEFGISDSVLEIIYGQTICWIGTFFAPLLPAIATIKYFVIFYIKKICLKHTRKPAARPIRASSSNFFFLLVLLIGLILCNMFFLFCLLYSIPSSKACGPFRNFNTSWEVIPDTIVTFPTGLQQVLFGMASEAFAVPFFMIICIIMFYFTALARAHKRVVEQLREQLVLVRFDPFYCHNKENVRATEMRHAEEYWFS